MVTTSDRNDRVTALQITDNPGEFVPHSFLSIHSYFRFVQRGATDPDACLTDGTSGNLTERFT